MDVEGRRFMEDTPEAEEDRSIEIADEVAAVAAAQGLVGRQVEVLAKEAHGSVAEDEVGAAPVFATECIQAARFPVVRLADGDELCRVHGDQRAGLDGSLARMAEDPGRRPLLRLAGVW